MTIADAHASKTHPDMYVSVDNCNGSDTGEAMMRFCNDRPETCQQEKEQCFEKGAEGCYESENETEKRKSECHPHPTLMAARSVVAMAAAHLVASFFDG